MEFDPFVEFYLGSSRRLIHDAIARPNGTTVIRLKTKFNPATGGSKPMIEEMTTKIRLVTDPLPRYHTIVLPGTYMDLNHFIHDGTDTYDEFYTGAFRSALRASAACSLSKQRTWYFRPGRPSVAIHVRRGDVTPARHPQRFTDDAFYYNLARVIQDHLPNADIHVFSSTRDQFRRGEKNHSLANANNRDVLHPSRSFDGYRERGMSVHLDGDPLEATAHMMTAQVLVTAKSAFSWLPALFNPHCIIFQPFAGSSFRRLHHWAVADDIANVSRALPACLGGWGTPQAA